MTPQSPAPPWPASTPPSDATAVIVRLIVVRHGETTWNAENRIQGQTDIELNSRGEAQARRLRARLADEPITAVYASDLQRAWRTAELAIEGRDIPVVRDRAWRELHFGEWEGLTSAETVARDPEIAAARRRQPGIVRPPGGEHLGDLRDRIAPAIEAIRLRHQGETVLVATHGGVVRTLGCHLLAMDLNLAWRLGAANVGLAVVDLLPDGPVIHAWNETAHLLGDQLGLASIEGAR
jgi:probable phosphoglycerate mutase